MVYLIGGTKELGQYPSEKLLDGDTQQIKLKGPVTDEMERVIALRHTHQYTLGYPVEPENVPTTWQWNSSREIPDYYTPHGFPCISSRIKDVAEKIEPDVHQFFPLTVVDKAKEKIAERWLWVVCNRIDGVDRKHTTYVLKKGALWMSNWDENGERFVVPNAKLYHSRKQTAGYHFWRDKHLMGVGIYASDEAAEALEALDLLGLAVGNRDTI